MNLTTPFEDSGHITRTTLAQEADHITELLDQYPAISRIELGASLEGRPIYALKLGTGTKRPIMFVPSIHADEPCPREAALTLIRDLADSPSPDMANLLAERALCIIPTPNPDGFPNSRMNAAGVNLNREWLRLPEDAPEIRAISNLMYEIDPVTLLDAHEWMHSTEEEPVYVGAVDMAAGQGVRDSARDMAEAIGGAFGGVPFYIGTAIGTSRHAMALIGTPGLLTETVFIAQNAAHSRPRRFADNRTAMETLLAHLATHADEYEVVSNVARAEIAARVGRTATTWTIDLFSPMDGSTSSGLAISAAGYIVPESEWPSAKALLDRHRIDYDDATRTVSLAQEKAQVAVLVLDPASPFTVSPGATRLQAPATPPPRLAYDPSMDLYENVVT